jgi:prolyl oligopeptidase
MKIEKPHRRGGINISAHAGHGIGRARSIRVNQQADIYAFLFDQLGMHSPQK